MDRLTPAQRSQLMSRIRAKETGPERLLRAYLRQAGLRGWRKNIRVLKGASSVDVAFTRWRIAIFVDGAFWHGHPRFFTPGKSGEFWDRKIARNRERDKESTRLLRRAGWQVVRVWDFEVEQAPLRIASAVRSIVRQRQRKDVSGKSSRPRIPNIRSKGVCLSAQGTAKAQRVTVRVGGSSGPR